MTAKELFYFTLPAPNLEKSKAFYKAVLGWKVGGGSLGGNVEGATTPCGLSPGAAADETAIYLTTFDLKESMEQVKISGGKVLRTEDFSVGPCAFCVDNQGTLFCLQEPSQELRAHAEKPPKGAKHGDLFFFSLPVTDECKAKVFYEAVLGWKFGEKGAQGGMGVTNLSGPDGGLGCGRPGHRPSFWFRVDDVQKICEAVKQAGGKPGEIFDGPEGSGSECLDDQGVRFGIIKPAPAY